MRPTSTELPPFFEEVPVKTSLRDLKLSSTNKDTFQEIIQNHKEKHRLFPLNLKPPQFVLLYGAAGTGKTKGAEAIACELSRKLFKLNLNAISNNNTDQATATLTASIDYILSNPPYVYLFDEFDAIASARSLNLSNPTGRQISNFLLICFDRIIASTCTSLICCSTNFNTSLDFAFHSRMNEVLSFELPAPSERAAHIETLLEKYFGTTAIQYTLDDIRELTVKTEDLSYRDITTIVESTIASAVVSKKTTLNFTRALTKAKIRRESQRQNPAK